MAVSLTTPQTLLGTVAPKSESSRLAWSIAVTVLGTLLLTLSAKVNVPGIPVPTNFQTMAVALIAAAFGWKIGVATVVLYIAEGLSGLPVFTNGGGAAYLMSPTFGYILGFIPMAYIIGRAADAGLSRNMVLLFAVMIAADAVCLAFGYTWIVTLGSAATFLDQANVLGSAFAKTVQPFLIWDAMKMAFAAVTVVGAWQLLRRKA